MRESDVVKMLDQFLEANGWVSFPQNSHVRHGRTRYKNGTPDILAMAPNGGFFGFEVKLNKQGQLSKEQREIILRLHKDHESGVIVAYENGLVAKRPGQDWELMTEGWLLDQWRP